MGITLYIFVLLAAKSLQSCLTLSDPMDCSLPDSSIHGIFQSRVLEWGAIAFLVLCKIVEMSLTGTQWEELKNRCGFVK